MALFNKDKPKVIEHEDGIQYMWEGFTIVIPDHVTKSKKKAQTIAESAYADWKKQPPVQPLDQPQS